MKKVKIKENIKIFWIKKNKRNEIIFLSAFMYIGSILYFIYTILKLFKYI